MQFEAYSRYYDLLYQDKDYTREVEYAEGLLKTYGRGPRTILELGCGTGRHAAILASKGFEVTGVEVSDDMLQQSLARIANLTMSNVPGSFSACQGDARSVRLGKDFDAVISLFHVVSYQTENEHIKAMLETVSKHLKPGGVFVFDVWYGPAVLTLRPTTRVKRMEDDKVTVLRLAEPELSSQANQVVVNYTVIVTDKSTGRVEQFRETHKMRFYFGPELDLLARNSNLEIIHCEEWLTGNSPTEGTWGVCFVARKI